MFCVNIIYFQCLIKKKNENEKKRRREKNNRGKLVYFYLLCYKIKKMQNLEKKMKLNLKLFKVYEWVDVVDENFVI